MAYRDHGLDLTSEEFKRSLLHDLKLFTPRQISVGMGVSVGTIRNAMKRLKIKPLTEHQRNGHRIREIRQMVSDGFSSKEICATLEIKQQKYASLCRQIPEIAAPKGKRTTPFDMPHVRATLANRVRFAMEQCGYRQSDLAFHAGLSMYTLYNVLEGAYKTLPHGRTILGLAVALNVEVDWLLGHTVKKTKSGMPRESRTATRPGARYAKQLEEPSTT